MANQAPDRRQFLEMLAKASVASQFPGFSRWVFAYEHQHTNGTAPPPRPAHYQPQFYTPGEYQTIAVVTELIIPHDESPGAQDAGVCEFIDFMAAHGEEDLQKPMQHGLQWLEEQAQKAHRARFVALTPATADDDSEIGGLSGSERCRSTCRAQHFLSSSGATR